VTLLAHRRHVSCTTPRELLRQAALAGSVEYLPDSAGHYEHPLAITFCKWSRLTKPALTRRSAWVGGPQRSPIEACRSYNLRAQPQNVYHFSRHS
jgi:hypothetical protein